MMMIIIIIIALLQWLTLLDCSLVVQEPMQTSFPRAVATLLLGHTKHVSVESPVSLSTFISIVEQIFHHLLATLLP